MKIDLHNNDRHLVFAPLSLTRPIGNLRMGILTNDARWKLLVPNAEIGFVTEDYMQDAFPSNGGLPVNGAVIANADFAKSVGQLNANEALFSNGIWLAGSRDVAVQIEYSGDALTILNHRWDLFEKNSEVLENDFLLLRSGKTSRQLSSSNTVIGDPNLVFLEEGAVVEASILNTTTGSIYIGKDAEVMEGCMLRGPIALCDHAAFKMGTKVYGATTIGPHCKVGGEVTNVIFQAYSNKGHDGFLGNSLIGEWCNLGADTNSSNLKNNYGKVKTYDYSKGVEVQTEVQFMGLTMGDHSKCGINTMFNTATVIGVSSNVFGGDFPPKFIPSFAWGVDGENYDFNRALESANNMMSRRGKVLSSAEIAILKYLSDTE